MKTDHNLFRENRLVFQESADELLSKARAETGAKERERQTEAERKKGEREKARKEKEELEGTYREGGPKAMQSLEEKKSELMEQLKSQDVSEETKEKIKATVASIEKNLIRIWEEMLGPARVRKNAQEKYELLNASGEVVATSEYEFRPYRLQNRNTFVQTYEYGVTIRDENGRVIHEEKNAPIPKGKNPHHMDNLVGIRNVGRDMFGKSVIAYGQEVNDITRSGLYMLHESTRTNFRVDTNQNGERVVFFEEAQFSSQHWLESDNFRVTSDTEKYHLDPETYDQTTACQNGDGPILFGERTRYVDLSK